MRRLGCSLWGLPTGAAGGHGPEPSVSPKTRNHASKPQPCFHYAEHQKLHCRPAVATHLDTVGPARLVALEPGKVVCEARHWPMHLLKWIVIQRFKVLLRQEMGCALCGTRIAWSAGPRGVG